jgi:quercetin dioxygenase-like cupin family protein
MGPVDNLVTTPPGEYITMILVFRRAIALVLLVVTLAGALGIAAGAQSDATPAATPEAPAVVREVINEGEPASAPGMTLQLVRYTIPGDIALPAHTHPGMQVNTIVSGTLTFTVVEGEAAIIRADGTMETLSSGETTDLLPGDSLTEPEGMVHFGANMGEEPIVILTASLFMTDEAPSTIVDLATPAPQT